MRERVNAQQVMHFVDKATPDTYDTDRALVIGVHARRLYAYRKQQWMERVTAEKVLDAFDLGYLLYTGDIDIEQFEQQEGGNVLRKRVQRQNAELRAENKYLRKSRANYKRKYLKIKEMLDMTDREVNSLPLPKPISKDFVKILDAGTPHW